MINKKSLQTILSIAIILSLFTFCDKEEEKNQIPVCSISYPNNNQEVIQGELVTISVDASDQVGEIEEVRFFINDIGIKSVTQFPYNYNLITDSFEVGELKIKTTAYDNNGAFGTHQINIIINSGGNQPNANFSVDIASGIAPLEVSFNDLSNNSPTSWLWNFGDGNNSNEQNPGHIYSTEGEFAVSLTVGNENGYDTELKPNYITVTTESPVDNSCPGIPILSDSLGNTYRTVQIGNQCWMRDNLKLSTEIGSWAYDDSPLYIDDYGLLYSWDAAISSCPAGWHLPSDEEWITLITHLGGVSVAGGKLKETGSLFWQSPNTGASNVSGFTAYAAGGRSHLDGIYGSIYQKGIFWTSVEDGTDKAYYRILGHTSSYFSSSSTNKGTGYSVRCIKD